MLTGLLGKLFGSVASAIFAEFFRSLFGWLDTQKRVEDAKHTGRLETANVANQKTKEVQDAMDQVPKLEADDVIKKLRNGDF